MGMCRAYHRRDYYTWLYLYGGVLPIQSRVLSVVVTFFGARVSVLAWLIPINRNPTDSFSLCYEVVSFIPLSFPGPCASTALPRLFSKAQHISIGSTNARYVTYITQGSTLTFVFSCTCDPTFSNPSGHSPYIQWHGQSSILLYNYCATL